MAISKLIRAKRIVIFPLKKHLISVGVVFLKVLYCTRLTRRHRILARKWIDIYLKVRITPDFVSSFYDHHREYG